MNNMETMEALDVVDLYIYVFIRAINKQDEGHSMNHIRDMTREEQVHMT